MKDMKNKQIKNEESLLESNPQTDNSLNHNEISEILEEPRKIKIDNYIDNTKEKLEEITYALEENIELIKGNITTVTSILQDNGPDSLLQTPIEDLDLEWLRRFVGSNLKNVIDLVGVDLTNLGRFGAKKIQKVLNVLMDIDLVVIVPSGVNFLIQSIIDDINTELENLKNCQLNIPNTKSKTISEITSIETYFSSNEASIYPIEFPNCRELKMSLESRDYFEISNRQLSDFVQILEYQVQQVRIQIQTLELEQEESNKHQLLQSLITDTTLQPKTKKSLIENGFSYIKDLIGCDLSKILDLTKKEIKDLVNLLAEMDLVTILPFGLNLIIEQITKNISEDAQTVNTFNLYKSHYTQIDKRLMVSLFYKNYGELTGVSSYKLDLLGVSNHSKNKTIKRLSEYKLALSELTQGEKVANKITSNTPINSQEFQDFINDEISLLFLIDYIIYYEYSKKSSAFSWRYQTDSYKWLEGKQKLKNEKNSTENKKVKRIKELLDTASANSLIDLIQKELCPTVSTNNSLYSDLAIELMNKIVVEDESLDEKSDMIKDIANKLKIERLRKAILEEISELELKVQEYKQLSNEDNEVIDKLNNLISFLNQTQ